VLKVEMAYTNKADGFLPKFISKDTLVIIGALSLGGKSSNMHVCVPKGYISPIGL
jgi:hypothetical protein